MPEETKNSSSGSLHKPVFSEHDVVTADALYAQGMAHYRRREWKEAKTCFVRLKEMAPDRSGIDALLNEVDIFLQLQAMQPDQKAEPPPTGTAVGTSRPEPATGRPIAPTVARRGQRGSRWPILLLALTLVVAVLAVLYAMGVFDQWIGDQQRARVQSLVNQGRAAMTVRDWDRAVKAFGDALALQPNNEDIKTWYAKAQRNQQLASWDTQADADIAAGQWSAALEKLQKITALDPTYNDVGQKIELVKSQQSLEAKFTEAQQYLEQDKWSEAIQAFEALQAQSPDFRTEDIKQALFLAHFRQGVDLMAKAGDAPDLMSQAIQSFDRALTILPGDKTAEAERQLANLYRQGYLFVSQKNWPQAVIVLQQVCSSRPDYMEGRATSMLCTSLLQLGDAYYAAGNLEQALEQYRSVLAIQDCDHVQAALKESEVNKILHPPTPTPTRTRTPTRTPLPTMTGTATPIPKPTSAPHPTTGPSPR